MGNLNFQTFFDCGFSKIRAGTFNLDNIDDYEKNKLAAFETVDADDEDYDNQDEV